MSGQADPPEADDIFHHNPTWIPLETKTSAGSGVVDRLRDGADAAATAKAAASESATEATQATQTAAAAADEAAAALAPKPGHATEGHFIHQRAAEHKASPLSQRSPLASSLRGGAGQGRAGAEGPPGAFASHHHNTDKFLSNISFGNAEEWSRAFAISSDVQAPHDDARWSQARTAREIEPFEPNVVDILPPRQATYKASRVYHIRPNR